jgi:Tol biopolymer transport system component
VRVWLVLLCGCGRIGFTVLPDAAVTAACEQAWLTSPTFGPPDLLSTVNLPASADHEITPFLASNELDLYFSSDRNGTDYDNYVASRATPTDPFGTPTAVTELASPADEMGVTLSRDRLTAYFVTSREGQFDMWRATRPSTDQPFGNLASLSAISSPATEYNPILSYDERELWFAAKDRAGNVGGTDIWRATRATLDDEFGQPEPVLELDTAAEQASPSLIATGRVIVFTNGPSSNFDLWYATRASTDVPFDPPQPIPGINSSRTEYTPFLRPDGCELFFTSSATGSEDIRVVRVQ